MKNILLKRILPLLMAFMLMFSVLAVNVSAEGGKTIMAFSDKYPQVGDTFTVTLTYKELDESITTVSGKLTFDSTMFKYIDTSGTTSVENISGGIKFTANASENQDAYIRVNLEVVADGSSRILLSEAVASNDTTDYTLNSSGSTVTTSQAQEQPGQNAQGGEALLSSITVPAGQLQPAFDPEVTEYRVTVPYTQKDGVLSCVTQNTYDTVSVSGSKELAVGITTRTITVISSNGSRRDYVVHFNRLDENGNDTTVPVGGGITFNFNGKEYYVGTVGVGTIPPVGFYLSTVTVNDTEISAYKDSSGKAVLLYLIASDSSDEGLFLYDNGVIYNFNYINAGGSVYIIKDIDASAIPAGLVMSEYVISGKTVSCLKYTDVALADFVVFSAISPSGNSGYYSYDVNENTMQRIVKFATTSPVSDKIENTEVSKTTKTVIMMLVIIFAILLIMLIIALVIKVGKKHGKNFGSIFEVEEEYEMSDSSDNPNE